MKHFYLIAMITVFTLAARLDAADVTLPHSFEAGTPARASDVNENFEALEDAVNEKVDLSGDTMTGNLTVPKVVYSTPRTHRYSISGDMFRPRLSSDEYRSGMGSGGARITTTNSTGTLMAQANLPDGATITSITYYVLDNDPDNDLIISGRLHNFIGYYQLIHDNTLSSGSQSATQALSVTPTGNNVVSNIAHTVVFMVWPDTDSNSVWSSNLYIRGVMITYTLPEAP